MRLGQSSRFVLTLGLLGALAAPALRADDAPPSAPAPDASAPASSAPSAAAKAPITQIEGAAPDETPAQRMERFKRERGAGSDEPFEGFAAEAEREMQRRRDAAIGGTSPVAKQSSEQVVEDYQTEIEKLQDKLNRFAGAWGGSPCMLQEPDWSAQDDWILYRRLAPADFLSEQPDKLKLTVATKEGGAAAYVAAIVTCVVTPKVLEVEPGKWIASLEDVRYFAVFSRKDSYLVADAGRESYLFQHEQLHFDLVHQLARWLSQHRAAIRAAMTSQGRSKEEALGRMQLAFGQHMLAVQRDARKLETAYDRDTRHGAVASKQTEWNLRIHDGLERMAVGLRLESRRYGS